MATKEYSKLVKKQGKRIINQDKLIAEYHKEHEILLQKLKKQERYIKKIRENNEILRFDLKLATKKKVAYRNQLIEAGIEIKSVFSKAYLTEENTHKSTNQDALVNNNKKNQILQ